MELQLDANTHCTQKKAVDHYKVICDIQSYIDIHIMLDPLGS